MIVWKRAVGNFSVLCHNVDARIFRYAEDFDGDHNSGRKCPPETLSCLLNGNGLTTGSGNKANLANARVGNISGKQTLVVVNVLLMDVAMRP